MYIFSIVLIVMSNVIYNLSQKSIPSKANPLVSLMVTYFIALFVTYITFLTTSKGTSLLASIKVLNPASLTLGFSIIGLELGYLLAYRAGWNISQGSLVANISLAIFLLIIGVIFYKESFGTNQIIGLILCISGLIFFNLK